MFKELKKHLIERQTDCPYCGKELKIGDIMFNDNYSGEVICEYCLEDYKDTVIAEEGANGALLK